MNPRFKIAGRKGGVKPLDPLWGCRRNGRFHFTGHWPVRIILQLIMAVRERTTTDPNDGRILHVE